MVSLFIGLVVLRSEYLFQAQKPSGMRHAASSGVCDAYYLQHIVEFVTNGNCNILTLQTDNSGVRMLSLKFGVGRLRRIRGRMLWLQERMATHELDIRQVPTLQNIADLNTKGHSKNRFLALLHMFGFVTWKGLYVGEDEFAKQQAKEAMKKHVKLVGQVLKIKNGSEHSGVTSADLYQTAKRVLRILSTCSLMELADGCKEFCTSSSADSGKCVSPAEALGQSGSSWLFFSLKIMLTLCVIVGLGLFWMRRRRIQAERQLENEEQHGGAANFVGDGSEAGETDSQLRARYLRSPMCEVSNPELWQRINHGDGSEESDSDVSMTTSQPHDPYAATVIEAIRRGDETISNLTICNWLLERCTRRLRDGCDPDLRLF